MARPNLNYDDHSATNIKIRAVVPRRPDREFHLKAVPKSENASWIDWYMGQKHWLD